MAHRLSYEFFVGRIPDGQIVRHKNDTPFDVNPHNLEIGTPRQNTGDMLDRGRSRPPRGVDHGQAVLTDDLVREIRYRYEVLGESCSRIAADIGFSRLTVSDAARRITWRHVS